MSELISLLESLKQNHNKSARDLSSWIKSDNGKGIKKGYSEAAITNAKKSGEGIKYNKLLKLTKEYISSCSSQNEGVQTFKSIPKIELYYNQKFYIYFYDKKESTDTHCISRAVLSIGKNGDDVFIKNVNGAMSTDYKGTVNIHPDGQHLIFVLHTARTKEKNLYMLFIISPEQIPPLAVGKYCNINKKGALVAGSLILNHIKEDHPDRIEAKTLEVGTTEYDLLDANVKKFLLKKEFNYTKVTTGIFGYEDLNNFFIRQEQKKKEVRPLEFSTGIFISAPMNSIAKKYPPFKKELITLVQCLNHIFNCEIYFGGLDKECSDDFDYPPVSYQKSTGKLEQFNKFILIYPEKLASSVLIEVGWALRAGKSCIFFVKNKADLPHLLLHFEHAKVRIIEYKNIRDIIRLFEKHKKAMFKN